jgi:hypothetical protein
MDDDEDLPVAALVAAATERDHTAWKGPRALRDTECTSGDRLGVRL